MSYEQREVYEDVVVFVVGGTKHDLSDAEIDIPDLTYTGAEQIANPKITYKGTQLTEGKDYELTDGFLATEAGDYKVTITGIGIYTGEVQCSYRVVGDNDNTSVLMGDLDGNKKMNLNDAKILLKGAVGIITLIAEHKKAADMNNDTKINLNDAKIALRIAVGIA